MKNVREGLLPCRGPAMADDDDEEEEGKKESSDFVSESTCKIISNG